MASLQRIYQTEGIPAVKGAQIPFSAGQNAGAAIAAAAQDVSQVAGVIARVERQKKDLAIKQEASFLESEAEREVAAGVAALAFERDPDKYAELHDKMLSEVLEGVRGRAKNPEAAEAFDLRSRNFVTLKKAEAYKHGNALFKERGLAQLDSTLDTRQNLAGLATSDEEFRGHFAKGQEAIDAAIPLIGEDKAGDMKRTFTQKALGARALAEANADPETFVERADDRFSALDAKVREELKQAARNKAESNRKSRNAEWEAYYKGLEDAAERERKVQVTQLEARALKGELKISELDDARAMRIVETREEYAAIYKAATAPVAEAKSDPATLTWVQMRTRGTTAGITPKILDSLFTAGKLNREDWLAEKGKLNALIKDGAGGAEGLTKLQKMSQAEQLMKADLDLTAPQDKWDQQDGQLYARGLDELTARAFEGNEDPVTVAREITQRFAPIRAGRIRLQIADYKRTLPAALQTENADKAVKLLDQMEKTGALDPSLIRAYRRTILDWQRREQSTLLQGGTTSGGAGKPLRPSGTKPESGK